MVLKKWIRDLVSRHDPERKPPLRDMDFLYGGRPQPTSLTSVSSSTLRRFGPRALWELLQREFGGRSKSIDPLAPRVRIHLHLVSRERTTGVVIRFGKRA